MYTLPPSGSDYEPLAADQPVETGRGYWAYFTAPTRVPLAGGAPSELVVAAEAGAFALIGNPNPDRDAVVEGAVAVYAWDPVAGRYVETNTLAPGQGAWALMPAEGDTP